MFGFIKNLFNKKNIDNELIEIEPFKAASFKLEQSQSKDYIEDYFMKEIELNNQYFKENTLNTILKHLTFEINLNKMGKKLTVEEKKALGLNTRLSITSALVDILSDQGVHYEYNPKLLLSNIYNKANITKANKDYYNKAIKAGITKFKLVSSGGGNGDCRWCKSRQKMKFLTQSDIEFFLDNQCECKPYSYSFLHPII